MIDNMSNAYTEVIELLKFFPKESIDKIPDEQAYDRKIREEELMRKYNPDSIFKKNN